MTKLHSNHIVLDGFEVICKLGHHKDCLNIRQKINQSVSSLCKNCKGTSFVYDALGTKFFCPKCYVPERRNSNE